MIGGSIIAILAFEDKVWINCQGTGCERSTQSAIFIEPSEKVRDIRLGDHFWWHDKCYWTPKDKNPQYYDVPLNRVGYSHDPKSGPEWLVNPRTLA